MGSCCSNTVIASSRNVIIKNILTAIERDNVSTLNQIINVLHNPSKSSSFDLDSKLISVNSCEMNALAYSLYIGSVECFKLLLNSPRTSHSALSAVFASIGKRPIDVICEIGHLPILEVYLPLYLNKAEMDDESHLENSEEMSIFSKTHGTKSYLDRSKKLVPMSHITAVQRACERSQLRVLKFFAQFFEERTRPDEFDVHFIDDVMGENCALIACKTGNVSLISYLYEVCGADFHIINKRRENAVQVMAAWSKKRRTKNYLDAFKYLIDVIGVDYKYEYEETLLILENPGMTAFLEDKLRYFGISITKREIEERYTIKRYRQPNHNDEEIERKLGRIKGPRFNFTELFYHDLVEVNESISAISQLKSKSVSLALEGSELPL